MDWSDSNATIESFVQFLELATAGKTLQDYHVIFTMGTMVRLRTGDPEFTGYTGQYLENLPVDVAAVLDENIAIWDVQKTIPGEHGRAVRIAYKRIIDDAYSPPGDRKSERFPIPCQDPSTDEILWNVVWVNRDPAITNLCIAESPEVAAGIVGELRKLDFVYPRAVAIISPDLTVTHL